MLLVRYDITSSNIGTYVYIISKKFEQETVVV